MNSARPPCLRGKTEVSGVIEAPFLTAGETGRTAFDPAVMAAMAKVRRHERVPLHIRAEAYANRPLPIGHGQIHLIPRYREDCADPHGGVRWIFLIKQNTGKICT